MQKPLVVQLEKIYLYSKFDDEEVVRVLTAMGQYVGVFLYSKNDIDFLLEHNKTPKGRIFQVVGKEN